MANYDTLKATIAARIHDNTEQEITALDVRQSFNDVLDAVNATKEDEGAIAPAQWGGITGTLSDQTDLAAALAAKQDTIADLSDIREGAAAGATAYQKPSGGIPGGDLDNGVRSDLNKARSAVQPGDLALVASTGDYDDLLDKPSLATVATSGSYDDLIDKPTIPPGVTVDQVYDATSANAQSGVAMAGALAGKQDVIADLATIEAGAAAGATSVQPGDLAAVATSGSYADLTGTPTIPAAPGTLDTDNSSAQTVSSSEALSGTVKLHKVSKTGSYNDLLNKPTIPAAQVNSDWNAASGVAQILNKPSLAAVATSGLYGDLTGTPTIPTVPTISTDIPTDKASNDKTTGAKAVYDFVKPATGSSIPAGGLLPGVKYHLGTLSGSVTMTLAAAADASVENEYKGDFTADSTPPTITWQGVTQWAGNCLDEDTGLPVLTGGKHYEFNIENGYGLIAEFGV